MTKFYRVKEGKHFAYLTAPQRVASQFTIRRDLDPDVKFVRWTVTFPGRHGWCEVLCDTRTLAEAKAVVTARLNAGGAA